MSTGDHDKPTSRQLHVTEGVLGKNEMSRVKRRTVTRPLREASEDDLQEFEHLHHSPQLDIPFDERLIGDLEAIEAHLDELKWPPPRGWVCVTEDHSWKPLPEDISARIAAEYGAMVEGPAPAAGLRIFPGASYIKRYAEALSLPWWLGPLGELIIQIFNETDPNKLLNRTLDYGCDRQRYLDQQGHLDNATFGHDTRESNRRKGEQSKRRPWAEILAEQITSWEDIPTDRDDALEIWGAHGEYRIFREGDKVICYHTDEKGSTERSLKRSSFEKRYLGPSLKARGQ